MIVGRKSPSSGSYYTISMVCETLSVARSSIYSLKKNGRRGPYPPPGGKRGPKTELSDDELLSLVREDLKESPFLGEGHRKVWARLRRKGYRVGRKRVLRIMRENNLLAPVSRKHIHGNRAHDGRITKDSPNVMWGTDGTRFYTEYDGWCWFFVAIEHFNCEVVGHHSCKIGDRFAALEPVRQGVTKHFGAIGPDVARGLTLRMDNGPQYTSHDFTNEIKFIGITSSPAFVGEPECNGMAEWFMRVLKEQVIWGRRFENLDEAKKAISDFIEEFNRSWQIERLGYCSPIEARMDHYEDAA